MLSEQVLVIDDDVDNLKFLSELLSRRFQVVTASDGDEGYRIARMIRPDVILLDIRMPKTDGIGVCNLIRNDNDVQNTPIIILSALNDEESRTRSFLFGADDFISKPFSNKELFARIDAKLRLFKSSIENSKEEESVIRCGNLILNHDRLMATINGKLVVLTVHEFHLLVYLVKNREKVLTRSQILQALWSDSMVTERTIDTYIAIFRKKLIGFDYAIATVHGAGYVLRKS